MMKSDPFFSTRAMKIPPRTRGSLRTRAERSRFARSVALPLQQFVHTEQTGGIVLLAAAILAMAAANSPWSEEYFALLHRPLTVDLGFVRLAEDVQHWVNDALMVLFFFTVGVEIKRELVRGELAGARRAALPAVAALGGMVVPALIYVAFNAGGPGMAGWGIPMATDIAFALGVLALLGRRIPHQARAFLLALAIADDIGAILVIAVFYTGQLSFGALGIGAAILGTIVLLIRVGMKSVVVYTMLGAAFWLAVYESGVHPTIAGVILGLLIPANPLLKRKLFAQSADDLVQRFRRLGAEGKQDEADALLGRIEELVAGTEPPVERISRLMHPWVSFVVIPVFAFVNSGVTLSAGALQGAAASPVTLGVLVGLVCGKPAGIFISTWLAVRFAHLSLPGRLNWRQLLGLGFTAGIGFTVSLFIASLAFANGQQTEEAKLGILAASLLAGLVGTVYLRLTSSHP